MTNWLTLEEAAQYLKMGKSTVYKLVRESRIPAHKMGREWRFDSEEVDEWLKAGKISVAGTKGTMRRNQERGKEWEYRACLPKPRRRQVIAVNKAGEGQPSNTVMAVL